MELQIQGIELDNVKYLFRKYPFAADCQTALYNIFKYLEYYDDTSQALDYCRVLCMNLFIVVDLRDLVTAINEDNPLKKYWEMLLDYSQQADKNCVRTLYAMLSAIVKAYIV